MEDIDVLIIHLNGEKILKNCLNSVYKNSPTNVNVYVLFNNTEDNSEEMVRKGFRRVNILRSNKRIGFSEGCNILFKNSSSKFVVFLNNDTVVSKGWVEELIKTMKRHPKSAACQPKVLSYQNKKKFEYAGAAGGFIDVYGFPFCRGRIFNFIEND